MNDHDSSKPHDRVEIERTYLLDRMPDLPPGAEAMRIQQGYIPAAADTSGHDAVNPPANENAEQPAAVEGRIRRVVMPDGSVSCQHTVKHGMGLVRNEQEWSISEQTFDELWPRTLHQRLSKTRYRVVEDDHVWEIDDFDSVNLVLAEIELPDPDTNVEIPTWLEPHIVRDVTDDPQYRNYELAADLATRQFETRV